MRRPDREAMARAIAAFLEAAGLDTADPELLETPQKVAQAWAEELLAGHRADPATILDQTAVATHHQPVVMTGIAFVGVCPHHLLPYEGTASLAYVPGERIAGFGTLVRLVTTLGARLVLQEDLARDVAEALTAHLGARGAGCIIEAKQGCVCMRGARQANVLTTTSAWSGSLAGEDVAERDEIARLLAGSR